jgi:hypothetical protein
MLDHSEESRAAVTKALDWAIAHLGEDPSTPSQLPIPTTTTPATTTPSTKIPATATATAAAPRFVAPARSASGSGTAAGEAATATAVDDAAPIAVPASQQTSRVSASTSVSAPVTSVVATGETAASRVVGREHAAYEAHDLEAFLAMYSPTAQLQLGDGPVMRGRRSLREHYRPLFEAGQCKRELVQRLLVGDWVVEQSIMHGTDQGPTLTITLYQVQEGRFLA